MTIRAIVFDIGGVLEITPSLGAPEQGEAKLGMAPGGLDEALREVWHAGSIGAISEDEVHRRIGDLRNLDDVQVTAFMDDMWTQYLGALNVELADYLRGLRPRYKTGIISTVSSVPASGKKSDTGSPR